MKLAMKLLLFLVVVLCLVGSGSAATYYVETSDSIVDGDTFCSGTCDATDTIIIRAGARGGLLFQDFDGAGSYITIKNEDNASNAVVEIDGSSGWGCLSIDNCKYLDIRGDNEPAQKYGIKVINDDTSDKSGAIWVYGQSDHINLSYLEATCEGSTAGLIGIQYQDSTEDANWTWEGIHIHHNYVHDTRYAGMYIGQNLPYANNNPWQANSSVHDNILEDLGAYGMCVKGVHTLSNPILIYNNSINNTGVILSDPDNTANHGISLSSYYGDTYANVYNNTISYTLGPGIRVQGPKGDYHQIHNNTLLGCGTGNNISYAHGISLIFDGNADIEDNIIIQPKRYGIHADSDTTTTTDSRNLIGDAGQGERFVESGGVMTEGTGDDANWYEADVADFGFDEWSDDNDYSNDLFTFTESESISASDFGLYKIITINQTMVNQSIGTGIYPLLVSTTDTDLRDHCQADGDDIVFFASDNTSLLPYEQEFWNSTNGELVEHVGVTDVTNATHIVMYYNNSTISNSENATGVWDSNFVVVQHLNETPAGTTYDSTSNNNDGTTVGMDSADQVSGQVDGSLDLDGADRISLTSLPVENNAAFTISTWMNGTAGGIVYSEGYSGNDLWALFLGIDVSSPYSARFYIKEADNWKALTTGTTQVNDTWHHVVLSQASKSSRTIYIDGAAEETDTEAVGDMSTLDTTNIGVLERDAFGSYFTGQIDELRISDTNRSAEWTETEYNNTAFPALFISIGSEQGEGAPDTIFEYWDGDSWEENPDDYHLWFDCFWNTSGYPDGVCPNAEQSGSQHSLRITNNGSAAGTSNIKFNESSPAEVTVYIDNDYTVAGAIVITDTYQEIGPVLQPGENVTLSAWVKLENLEDIWEFITYVEVQ